MDFAAPTEDQLLALRVCAGLDELASHERFAAASADMVEAVVRGAGEFAEGIWAPLHRIADTEGARLSGSEVILPAGFAEAYRAYVEAGWNTIGGPVEFGGQGMPLALATAIVETLGGACMAFALCPTLTVGAIEALLHHATPEQQARYLPKLVSGEWTGTMNLTEPQAGSDVGALRTSATPITEGEHAGKWRITGTKIFISWGEHPLAENIVHLVLARTPGAPAGSRGISLFVVPKFLVNADGSLGARNDLQAVRLEHKMGIHLSPTCEMRYGANDACIGEMVGPENGGLRAMFTMMNNARILVGAQGLEIAERAVQQGHRYARERVQSARAGSADKNSVAIVEHPDVRRMLLRMRALTEGVRALLYYTCGQLDRGALGDAAAQMRGELLVPLIKAWGTDTGVEVASLNVQVHGGMGYMEETGAAQLLRDARITPIYEGTNGIQAADLVTRKLGFENGGVLTSLMQEIIRDYSEIPDTAALARDCIDVAEWMRDTASLDDRLAGSVPFQTMCATVVGGWLLARQARATAAESGPMAARKAVVARYFNDHLVPEASGLKAAAMAGSALLYELDAETLAE